MDGPGLDGAPAVRRRDGGSSDAAVQGYVLRHVGQRNDGLHHGQVERERGLPLRVVGPHREHRGGQVDGRCPGDEPVGETQTCRQRWMDGPCLGHAVVRGGGKRAHCHPSRQGQVDGVVDQARRWFNNGQIEHERSAAARVVGPDRVRCQRSVHQRVAENRTVGRVKGQPAWKAR